MQNTKHCPSCGTDNPAEAAFCGECGAALPVTQQTAPVQQAAPAQQRSTALLAYSPVTLPRSAAARYPFGQLGQPFGHFMGSFQPGTFTPIRQRLTAAVLCLLLGPFGVHKFYTGQWGWGIVSLFLLLSLAWTGWIWGITYAAAIAEAILLFTMTDEDFQNKYHVRAV